MSKLPNRSIEVFNPVDKTLIAILTLVALDLSSPEQCYSTFQERDSMGSSMEQLQVLVKSLSLLRKGYSLRVNLTRQAELLTWPERLQLTSSVLKLISEAGIKIVDNNIVRMSTLGFSKYQTNNMTGDLLTNGQVIKSGVVYSKEDGVIMQGTPDEDSVNKVEEENYYESNDEGADVSESK